LHENPFNQIRNVKTISIESLEIKGVYMSLPVFTSRLIFWVQRGFFTLLLLSQSGLQPIP